MMSVLTFACEKCGEVHTSEARFHINKFECSELGEDAGAECLENCIYAEQEKLITKKYGKKVADLANYGQGVDGDEDHVSVSTKVYGYGYLSTVGYYKTGEIDHEWQEHG